MEERNKHKLKSMLYFQTSDLKNNTKLLYEKKYMVVLSFSFVFIFLRFFNNHTLPEDFAYLNEIVPDIEIDLRYSSFAYYLKQLIIKTLLNSHLLKPLIIKLLIFPFFAILFCESLFYLGDSQWFRFLPQREKRILH